MRRVGSEEELCFQLANYLRLRHPDVLYHWDFGSGTRLSMKQAVAQKRLNGRAWPDLLIAKPAIGPVGGPLMYCGMFIELKREGTRITKRDGSWASEHIAEQGAVLERLANEGYIAQFAVGLESAIELIESYLNPSTEAVSAEAF